MEHIGVFFTILQANILKSSECYFTVAFFLYAFTTISRQIKIVAKKDAKITSPSEEILLIINCNIAAMAVASRERVMRVFQVGLSFFMVTVIQARDNKNHTIREIQEFIIAVLVMTTFEPQIYSKTVREEFCH